MNCRRNRSSFDSFTLFVYLIWRVLLVWSWRNHRSWGFLSPLTFYLRLSYHYLVSSVLVAPHSFWPLPSYLLSLYFSASLALLLIIVFCVTFSFPWSSPFFYPDANKHLMWWSFPPSTTVDFPQQCVCHVFRYDKYGDHLQTFQTQSETLPSHDWVVYKLGDLLGSVGHKVKIHKITPPTGKVSDWGLGSLLVCCESLVDNCQVTEVHKVRVDKYFDRQ